MSNGRDDRRLTRNEVADQLHSAAEQRRKIKVAAVETGRAYKAARVKRHDKMLVVVLLILAVLVIPLGGWLDDMLPKPHQLSNRVCGPERYQVGRRQYLVRDLMGRGA